MVSRLKIKIVRHTTGDTLSGCNYELLLGHLTNMLNKARTTSDGIRMQQPDHWSNLHSLNQV